MKSKHLKGKRLLILGGLRNQVPVIRKAQELGCYVISGDIYPDNYSHKFSDEYRYINVVDNEQVFLAAKELNVDGIMSFAVDAGVSAAAYACEKLGLPHTGSYKSVRILQNKHLFREFLKNNGFNAPKMYRSTTKEEAVERISELTLPVIVKPVDSAGSKGVTKVEDIFNLDNAFDLALRFSISKQVIIEEFITPNGHPSDSDCFSINGELVFFSMSDQYFDKEAPNPFTPSGYIWCSSMQKNKQQNIRNDLQRLISLLDMKSGIYNVESRMGCNGEVYLMECSPRGGGPRLAEIVSMKTGIDFIENSVFAALNQEHLMSFNQINSDEYWGELILHSNKDGIYRDLAVDESVKQYIVETDLWVKPGDEVKAFDMANTTIGTMIVKSRCREDIERILENHTDFVKVKLK